ncbi:AAA family ATPase [Butyrivibrio sp. AC2005]|uniref:AAA family ATPase n=1 Tax=Butyrivibrio sp. AC2005 TaxID=1280672 RepID=UPI000416FFCB|nr:AAA family ATPase [Butyrivibrio sp. AC2005]
MAKKLISFNFNGEFVPELEALTKRYPISEVSTTYCTTAASRMKEYNTDTYLAEAIANYIGSIDTMHLFVGKTSKNEYVAEYKKPDKDEIQICIGQIKDGKFQFKAGIISETGLLGQYAEGHKGTMFAMAMFPEIAKDSEAMSFIDILKNYDVSDENYSKSMCGLSNNMYYRLKDEKSTSPVRYEQEPKKLSQADIDAVKVGRIFCGEPKVFNRTAPLPSEDYDEEEISGIPAASLRDMYPLDEGRVLSAEEEARVPQMGDWYVVPEWSMKTAKRIAASNRFRKSIRNILLYGPSGTGKTEGSQAIAEMLGLPYYTQTCSPDDDKFDILGQLIPNTGKGKTGDTDEACKQLDIPTFSDVENDFKTSFMKLFGKEPGKLDSEADCYQEITKRLLEKNAGDENDFVYVKSELIQAIKHGGFCEIQEANIIKRASVLEALNPLLAGGGKDNFIKLPTGEVITRHPDCVIAFTVNREYEGCNDLQEAVYSRINLIKQIPEPSEDELFSRTKAQTGFDNAALLKKMAKCVVEIHQYCREKDITGGVCGPRELIDWAQDAILESEDRGEDKISEKAVIAAALETVLEKVAQNEDDIEDVITGVFNKHFNLSTVNGMRRKK